MHLLLNFGHTVTRSLLLNNTSYYEQSLGEADNDFMVNGFHTSMKTTDLMLWSDSDLCEAYMGERDKLMDMPIWQCNISVKW